MEDTIAYLKKSVVVLCFVVAWAVIEDRTTPILDMIAFWTCYFVSVPLYPYRSGCPWILVIRVRSLIALIVTDHTDWASVCAQPRSRREHTHLEASIIKQSVCSMQFKIILWEVGEDLHSEPQCRCDAKKWHNFGHARHLCCRLEQFHERFRPSKFHPICW